MTIFKSVLIFDVERITQRKSC